MNHRATPRSPALVLARIQRSGNRDATGLIYNISHDGMFVLTQADVRINGSLDILIDLDTEQPPLRIPGYVMHRNGNGFGMVFRYTSSALDDLVRKLCRTTTENIPDRPIQARQSC